MNILIISKLITPESGVGGRRWNKIGKIIADHGHQITFITSNFSFEINERLRNHPNCSIISIPTFLLKLDRNSLVGRLIFYLSKKAAKIFGFIDFYEPWSHKISKIVKKELGNKNYDVVITSGHPCSLNYHVSKVQCNFKFVRFIHDFRDLWNSEVNYSLKNGGIGKIGKKRSLIAQDKVLDRADRVYAVS